MSLILLGPAASNAIPWLIEATNDKDHWVRVGAAAALGSMGTFAQVATTDLMAGLTSSDSEYRLACFIALKDIDGGSAVMDRVWVAYLHDPDWNMRAMAAEALGQSPGRASDAISGLLVALRDTNAVVVSRVALTLGRRPEWAGKSVSALLGALGHALAAKDTYSMSATFDILKALADLGPAAETAVPALADLLGSKVPSVGTFAASAWRSIEPDNPKPVTCLAQKLETGNSGDRIWAAWALGKSGPFARATLPALESVAKRYPNDRNLQTMVAAALWRIDPARPNPTRRIIELAGGELGPRDWPTIRLLGELGPAARQAVPMLLEAYKSNGSQTLRDTMEALQKIDPDTAANPWR